MGIHGPITEKQHDALARVTRAQRHLLGLINDVLNYARLERGRVEYDLEPVALTDVVAHVGPMIEPQLAAKGLTYQVRMWANDCVVWADRDKLVQVLLNLLSNAVKFTPSGGSVVVDVTDRTDGTQPKDVIYLRVSDTGVGIPYNKLESAFEPFVQVTPAILRAGREQAWVSRSAETWRAAWVGISVHAAPSVPERHSRSRSGA